MSIVIYVESQQGTIKKAGFEIASYGRAMADATGQKLVAVVFNQEDASSLNTYGVDLIYSVSTPHPNFEVEGFATTLAAIIQQENATLVALSATANGRYLGPILAVKTSAAFFSNVVALPSSYEPIKVKRSCFTNKAFNLTTSAAPCSVLCLNSNAFGLHEKISTSEIKEFTYQAGNSTLAVTGVDQATNIVTIADADIVVSGGRGLKGPEHWHLIEDLAEVLGAATACSKPVSDMGWRPHSEHVGQTGKPVASNLYIAIGVSGAIQHLAGVSASKVKVVINIDPEAPFFKAADYGVVGDAFEVVPQLIEKLKARL
ncbi:electron transfer flavoprotein subunit alpha/FixB family protein [Flavobacteriaceae bacterium]|nr:electron transfer flavoprotein subunit alpha/FixB family protein [Flavobacteriaceae bacterium]